MLNVLNCTSKKRFPDGATFFSSEALIFWWQMLIKCRRQLFLNFLDQSLEVYVENLAVKGWCLLAVAFRIYSYFKKGCHSQQSILEPKGAVGIVIMSDNTPAKFITVWPWHHDERALYILSKVNVNSNKLLEKFEPHSSFPFQYRLLTMTTFIYDPQ